MKFLKYKKNVSKKTCPSFYPIKNKTIISYDKIDPNYSQTSTSNSKLSLRTPKTSAESYLKVMLSIFLGVFIFTVFIILFFSRKVSNYMRNIQRRIEIAESYSKY
jgi:ATP-dependent Zn protease